MYENQRVAATSERLSGLAGNCGLQPPPTAGVRERLQELLGLIREADSCVAGIRESIFGPSPTPPNDASGKIAHQPAIEEIICIAVQAAAQLASEARNIRERL